MIGEGRTRGQAALLSISACNNQNCAAIRVSLTEVPPTYVYRYLESQYAKTRQGSSGNNQPALNKSSVSAITIPLPPLAEQLEIATLVEQCLSIVERVDADIERSLERSLRLRQSILKRAFEGKLVSHAPGDEPTGESVEKSRGGRKSVGEKDDARGTDRVKPQIALTFVEKG